MTRIATVVPTDNAVLYASGRWYVQSRRLPDTRYEVTQLDHNDWQCQCPASNYARGTVQCWHVRAVRRAAARRGWIHARTTDDQLVRQGFTPFSAYRLDERDCHRCGSPLMTTTAPAGRFREPSVWLLCVRQGCGYREPIGTETMQEATA